MVREQLEALGISHHSVLAALGSVPRELFVDEALRGEAYGDRALPIGANQTISQPWIVARMSELAEPDGTGRVLEIGTGSGYQSAVLSSLFEQVYSIERVLELSRRARSTLRELGIENVHLKVFDGSYGWSEFAPYRAILVTAATPTLAPPWVEQLEEGGRLIVPVRSGADADSQTLLRLIKRDGRILREEHGSCRFVPLLGKYGWIA